LNCLGAGTEKEDWGLEPRLEGTPPKRHQIDLSQGKLYHPLLRLCLLRHLVVVVVVVAAAAANHVCKKMGEKKVNSLQSRGGRAVGQNNHLAERAMKNDQQVEESLQETKTQERGV